MNILVVDDEREFRLLLKSSLSGEGRIIFLAENGEDALARMKTSEIDLFISDVYMPVMDGIKLRRKVRQIPGYERVPFLFVSGYDDESTKGTVQDPRIDGFFKKGRSMEELKEWIAYLTAPEDKRPKIPPAAKERSMSEKKRDPGRRGGSPRI